MKCPTCGESVIVAPFKQPRYVRPTAGDDPRPVPLRYWQDAECANGCELVLRDGTTLLSREGGTLER